MLDVDVVLFDIAGTLFPSIRESHLPLLREWLGERPDLDPAWQEVSEELFRTAWERPFRTMKQIYVERIAAIYERLGVQRSVAADAVALYARVRRLELYPEVPAILEKLEGRLRLGLLSNADNDDPLLALACGLARFDVVVTSEEALSYKPAPGIFWLACERAGVAPERCAYVGDRPWEDVHGAIGAGMQAVWVNRVRRPYPSGIEKPTAEVVDLCELLPLLRVVRAGRG